MRHWESLPINIVEQYRSRVEQLSCVLKAFNSFSSIQQGGGAGRALNPSKKLYLLRLHFENWPAFALVLT